MHILFWIHKSKSNKEYKAPITMRITISGERIELKTKLYVVPEQWNKEKQRIIGDDPLVKEYNDTLLALTSKAWNYYTEALKGKETIKPIGVKNFILNKDQPKQGCN